MKKNTLHKVMATALVGAMAMSTLTGCGSSADNTTADAGTKESVAESSVASTDAGASTAVAGIDGWRLRRQCYSADPRIRSWFFRKRML